MLRWFFLILLLLNAVLYGWFYQEQEQRRAVADRVEMRLHGVAELDLISEVPDSALRLREPEFLVEERLESKLNAELYCYRFGPFEDARGLEGWLGDDGPGRLELKRDEVAELSPDYRVYVSAPGKTAARQDLLRSVRSVGLQGEWLDEGPLKGKLSLGVYQEQVSAQALEKALVGQGFDAAVFVEKNYSYQYYLLLRSDFKAVSDTPWMRSLMRRYPSAVSEKKLCQGLATVSGPE